MTKQYTFFADVGHGWLSVKRKELVELDIINKISSYSYQRGDSVYLEEDCDASVFFAAKGWDNYGNAPIKESYSERSPIRSYQQFRK